MPASAADTSIAVGRRRSSTSARTSTVEGRVLGVHCSPLSCLLAFDPTFNRFTAVVQAAELRARFPPDAARARATPAGGCACTARSRAIDRKPEIVVDDPTTSRSCATEPERARRRERRARAQDADRGARAPRRRCSTRVDGADRAHGRTQERMETLLAQLEQRAPRSPRARRPAAGRRPRRRATASRAAPGVRGAAHRSSAAWRRPTSQRLIGEPPDRRAAAGNGWTTWYYDYGRSVSFDGRGRAQSMVGFPAP